jgi:hypothetical protein
VARRRGKTGADRRAPRRRARRASRRGARRDPARGVSFRSALEGQFSSGLTRASLCAATLLQPDHAALQPSRNRVRRTAANNGECDTAKTRNFGPFRSLFAGLARRLPIGANGSNRHEHGDFRPPATVRCTADRRRPRPWRSSGSRACARVCAYAATGRSAMSKLRKGQRKSWSV